MKVIFGVVGLLLALAIVASLSKRQLQAVGAVPALAGASGPTVREQSQAVQKQVQQDVTRAMQAAPARNDAAEQ